MKQLMHLALAVAVLILMGFSPTPVWAQDEDEGRSTEHRFEAGFRGGGFFSSRLDFRGQCVPIVPGGCDLEIGDFEDETTDPFFVSAGDGLTLNAGQQFGVFAGVDLTAHWQFEFTWDYSTADSAFENESLRIASIGQEEGDDNIFIDPGEPRGHVNIYQFNLNYHTRTTGKLVPYVGGGLGWMDIQNPPILILLEEGSDDVGLIVLDEDTPFAFNVGLGAKYFVNPHIGVRVEWRQLFSFYNGTHIVRTFDNVAPGSQTLPNLLLQPISTTDNNANFIQKSTFTHFSLTAGVFVRF